MLAPVYQFYAALARLADYNSADITADQQRQAIFKYQHQLQQAAASAPMNYLHKCDLVAAELARIEGQVAVAMTYYDRAIEGALENGYIQEAALANERAAEFYRAQGKKRIAQAYMTDAYYGYIQWGAIAKVQQLEAKYPELIIRDEPPVPSIVTLDTVVTDVIQSIGSTSSSASALDLTTVMKAAQAISGELNLHHLLEKLLSIILENAGACKGCLILEKEEQLFVEAVASDADRTFVVLQSTPVETSSNIPISLVNYVARTQHTKVFANASQYMGYGRSLITAKRMDRALEVFNASHKKNGDVYAVNAGFMSYYSAKNDYKKALSYAEKALTQASNDAAKNALNANIAKLKEGKDINQ